MAYWPIAPSESRSIRVQVHPKLTKRSSHQHVHAEQQEEKSRGLAHPTRARRSTIRDNPWKGARFDLIGVLLNLCTYALLVSDVPRAGVLTNLKMRELSPGEFSWFGSFAYQVITIYRDPDNWENITAVKNDNVVDHGRVWSYCYDTTSVGIRTIASHFNDTDKYIINCMNYRIRCGPMAFFTPTETFYMLDRLIGYPAMIPKDQLPAMNKVGHVDPYQHVRLSRVVKNRHVWILHDYLVRWVFGPVQHRLIRASFWENATDSFDACANPQDRPYMCDSAYADYGYAAEPSDAESMNVTFVWLSMNEQVHQLYQQYHNLTANMTVEVLIVEGYTEPMTYVGGWSNTVSWEFDMVLFTRVRDCSGPASKHPNDEACVTIRVQDYRFEGGQLISNVQDWNHLIELLRILGQLYYFVRVLTLVVACYYAFPVHQRSWQLTAFVFLSEVPSHVVAFGSFIPITLYTVALCIDGPSVNAILHSGGMGLQGNFVRAPGAVYRLICLLMRKQWLMAFLTMVWVRLQATSGGFNRQQGITSIRGHIFGILASMSMVAGYYNPKMRDTHVVGQNQLNPDRAVLNTRLMAPDEMNRRLGGYYSDLFAIAVSGVVHVVIVLVFRFVQRALYRMHLMLPTSFPTASRTASKQVTSLKRMGTLRLGRRSFFTCQTAGLPSTCNTLWMIEGLTCGWSADVFISVSELLHGRALVDRRRRNLVMNLVQMSEPFNYVRWRLGVTRPLVYTYRDMETQRTFMTVNQLNLDELFPDEHKNESSYQVVRVRHANELSFHELVRIR